jgi:hypothetical protein
MVFNPIYKVAFKKQAYPHGLLLATVHPIGSILKAGFC